MSDSLATFARRVPLQVTGESARILDSQSRICAWAFNQLKSLADDLRSGYARLKAARQVEPERRHAGLDAGAAEIGVVLYGKRGLRNLLSVSNRLCKRYDLIGVGDYAPAQGDAGLGRKTNRAMKNRSLLGRFKSILQWVAQRSGKSVEVFDETGTTRTCSEPGCGHIVAGGIPPDIREWSCPQCGTLHIRDENAAKNGLVRMLRIRSLLLPSSGPVQGRCDWRFHPGSGWREAPKGRANANQNGWPGSTGTAKEAVFIGLIRGVIAPDLRPAQY